MQVVLTRWPEPQEPYFTSCDELSVQDGLLFKTDRIIMPASLRQHVIRKVHNSHMGTETVNSLSHVQKHHIVLYIVQLLALLGQNFLGL